MMCKTLSFLLICLHCIILYCLFPAWWNWCWAQEVSASQVMTGRYKTQWIKDGASLPPNVQFNCWHWGDRKVGTQGYTGFSLQFDLIRVWFRFRQDTMWESRFEQLSNQPSSTKRGHPALMVWTHSLYNHWNGMGTFWITRLLYSTCQVVFTLSRPTSAKWFEK